jgi:phage/plasmid primase-like uncharacterized protein
MTDSRVETARRVPIETVLHSHRIALKKIGNELIGPCPHCGGKDRFAVSLTKNLWNCRGCGQHGDVIALEQFLGGGDLLTAVERLSGQKSANGEHRARRATLNYDYRDPQTGAVRYRKKRFENPDGTKTFSIEPKGRGGSPACAEPFRPAAAVGGLIAKRASDIEPEPISWLWQIASHIDAYHS